MKENQIMFENLRKYICHKQNTRLLEENRKVDFIKIGEQWMLEISMFAFPVFFRNGTCMATF